MLTETQCKLIETGLTEDVDPRKVAAYLCLHMGLMLMEVTALQWKDIDFDANTITLHGSVSAALEAVSFDPPRVLHMPPHVVRYLQKHSDLYGSSESYILSGKDTLPPFHLMQNILTTVSLQQKLGEPLSATDLRQTFIRRCIQVGMDLYNLCAYIDIRQPNVIAKKYAEYFPRHQDDIDVLEQFAADYVPPADPEPDYGPKQMNLLILGAGGQGHVVKETAEAIGIFEKIDFLDDNTDIPGVLDTPSHLDQYVERYPMAFVAIGRNETRQALIEQLQDVGYIVPVLRHPTATISSTVEAGAGTIFEAKVIVNASVKIGKGVILASACVIDHGCVLGDYVHVDVGAMLKKDCVIEPLTKIASGSIVSADE